MRKPRYNDAVARHLLAARQAKADEIAKAERLRARGQAVIEAAERVCSAPLANNLKEVEALWDSVRAYRAEKGE